MEKVLADSQRNCGEASCLEAMNRLKDLFDEVIAVTRSGSECCRSDRCLLFHGRLLDDAFNIRLAIIARILEIRAGNH